MAQFPCLPLWTDALVGDTYFLSPAEFGCYMRLLIAMWRGKGYVPNNDTYLSRCTNAGKNWQRLKPAIWSFMTETDDGRLTQLRLLDEYDFVSRKSEVQSSLAKRRWLKNNNSDDALASSRQCDGIAPTPTPTPHKPPNPRKRVGDTDTPEFIRFWDVYPLKKEKGAARKAFSRAIVKVDLETLVMKAGEYAIDRQRAGMEYVKNPATWLNKECWLDETQSAKKVVRFRQ